MIRFTVTSAHTKLSDIERDWEVILSIATMIIEAVASQTTNMAGDDQLEENGVEPGEEVAGADAEPRRTKKMPLAGNLSREICTHSDAHLSVSL